MRYFNLFLGLAAIIMLVVGCRIIENYNDDEPSPNSNSSNSGTIWGQITASGTITTKAGFDPRANRVVARDVLRTPHSETSGSSAYPAFTPCLPSNSASVQAGIRTDVEIENADVWLQDDPDNKDKSDSRGRFNLRNVQFGINRVVANLTVVGESGQKKRVYKVRSPEISLSPEEPEKAVGTLTLEVANNSVQGVLRDSQGNPLANVELRLWGERFFTDEFGRFISPPLPDSSKIEEIEVVQSAGFKPATIVAPFSTGEKPIIETTLSSNGSKNDPPKVRLLRYPGGKLGFGAPLKVWAIFHDPNDEDTDKLVASWTIDDGTMTGGNEPVPEVLKKDGWFENQAYRVSQIIWVAPSVKGNYKIKCTVTDPAGDSVSASRIVKVRTVSNENNDDDNDDVIINLPPAVRIVADSKVLIGERLLLEAVASDPNNDILSFSWNADPGLGLFERQKAQVTSWIAPSSTGTVKILCVVSDFPGDNQPSLSFTAQHSVEIVSTVSPQKGTIIGRLFDPSTNSFVASAVAGIAGNPIYNTYSKPDGSFKIEGLDPGTYDVVIYRKGYLYKTIPGVVVK